MEFVRIASELIVGYFALLILTKFLGKTQLSQITAFDFISALVLGELVGNALFDEQIGIGKILFVLSLWGLLVFGTEMVTQKFRKTRPFLEGGPSIVIQNGKIVYEALKKNHLDLDQLQHLLRSKDVFSIKQCEFAILETDGTISVMKKPDYECVTKKDMQIQTNPPSLSYPLILDGEIVDENLQTIGWDEKKLKKELAKLGFTNINDILYCEWEKEQRLYIQEYENE
ncbi:DUF421 domain-containing protein [Fervidibacillus halotolerans]|uniref:DUF421 domain-containing protein n=1 Tax=Fervidibacillus halotolerans TaxID=2980027 RepID=A0A9E8M2C8_9BACI|nr:DUF421 domain-containing protein [Fervidibacillus halotolerans]WAA13089.1 DUF421 domain-containing protein [Fervidibacillus halotolerans]